MKKIPQNTFIREAVSVVFICLGFFALITPLTPGSWLLPIGMAGLLGRERTRFILMRWFGKKLYDKLRIDTLLGE